MLEEITVGNPEFSLWVCLWGTGSGVRTNVVLWREGGGKCGVIPRKTLEKGGAH